ncbi:MAG: response regulator [Euryarchaeota archaeon]|nr:response regulator [Euryarchaeota archaeon]
MLTRYLVVDDSPAIRLRTVSYVKQADPRPSWIIEAGSREEALDLFAAQKPDVVFLDMVMKGDQDGLDTLRAIVKTNPKTIVVMCTGLSRDDPSVLKAISEGAFDYIQKPVRSEDVKRVLDLASQEIKRIQARA